MSVCLSVYLYVCNDVSKYVSVYCKSRETLKFICSDLDRLKQTRVRRQERESDNTFFLRSTFRHKTLGLRKSRQCYTVRLRRASLFIRHAPISELSMSQLYQLVANGSFCLLHFLHSRNISIYSIYFWYPPWWIKSWRGQGPWWTSTSSAKSALHHFLQQRSEARRPELPADMTHFPYSFHLFSIKRERT